MKTKKGFQMDSDPHNCFKSESNTRVYHMEIKTEILLKPSLDLSMVMRMGASVQSSYRAFF